MSLHAPLRVPVELKRASRAPAASAGERWFRLAEAVGADGVTLSSEVPVELDGPLEVAFHLPGAAQPIRCHGEASEVVVVGAGDPSDERGSPAEGEHAERRALALIDLSDDQRTEILQYVQERLGLHA